MKQTKRFRDICMFSYLYLYYAIAWAVPFPECPSQAFLVQDNVAKIYGVNLATGYYELLSDDMATNGKLNAMGFNFHDNYLYAFSYDQGTLVTIGADFQVQALEISNLPRTNFYVGDVSLAENAYYAYAPGNSLGLYKITLSSDTPDYLSAIRIASGAQLNLRIFDFAFHPLNGDLYSVDASGFLYAIDPHSGGVTSFGNVGVTGTFGAVYFDSEGKFYISRNQDGHIFRISLQNSEPKAEFFAYGPSSSNNDGARCATSSIISDIATIDFGTAPNSYGSNIDNNGARHEYKEGMHIGTLWGGNDDGVEPLTTLELGTDALLSTDVSGTGFINVWADWNQNGQFDDYEHMVVDQSVQSGQNLTIVAVPFDAKLGKIWGRVRLSSTQGIGPNGGVSDGEVEDFQLEVLNSGVSVHSYPSTGSYSTLAFEDNWPELGDYDMNDVVLAVRTHRFTNNMNEVLRYDIEGKVLALGAGYHNGFGIVLDGISTEEVDISRSFLSINGFTSANPLIENNPDKDNAVLIFFDDLKSFLPSSQECPFYRTQSECADFEKSHEATFRATVSLKQGIASQRAPTDILNPFIFATPGTYHGDSFSTPPGRSLEIHLKNKPPSTRFNLDFFNIADDHSTQPVTTFVTSSFMPWAMEIPILWPHPKERVDLIKAYPKFSTFVESKGTIESTWYLERNAISSQIISNQW